MLASPESSVLNCILENDYIFPSVELLGELLSSLKLPAELFKSRFSSLLDLANPSMMSEASKNVVYHDEDEGLRASVKQVLGSENKDLLTDVYDALYVLRHQYVLNKSPDKQSDIENNDRVALRAELEHLSPEAIYESTVPLFGTLLKRLEKFDKTLASDALRQLVLVAINQAKEKILNAPKKEETTIDPLLLASTFVPAYKDPVLLKRRQEIQDAIFAEELARQLEEEDNLQAALAIQAQDSDNDDDNDNEDNDDDEPEQVGAGSAEVGAGHNDQEDDDEQEEEDAALSDEQPRMRRSNP